ncbi:MAG TPA: hypothetical protein DF984_02960 [Anaerolineaceae bacterium]|nr:hypothetical protein [Anaerolineaceae bacterium]
MFQLSHKHLTGPYGKWIGENQELMTSRRKKQRTSAMEYTTFSCFIWISFLLTSLFFNLIKKTLVFLFVKRI